MPRGTIATSLIGQKFGRLTILARAGTTKGRKALWLCQCECGAQRTVAGGALKCGNTTSCGCARDRHGYSGRPVDATYVAWTSMRQRCLNPKYRHWKNYGGRGITICERWSVFENFLADMGDRPSDKHSVDRYPDNDGNYEPSNCRWATVRQQIRNSRTVKITYADALDIARRRRDGELSRVLAAEYGMNPGTIGKIGQGRLWPDAYAEAMREVQS